MLEDQRVPGYIEGYVRRFWQVRAGQQNRARKTKQCGTGEVSFDPDVALEFTARIG